jgi:hypothetical protein
MDPLDGENGSASSQVKPDYRVSSSADDIFLDDHDVIVTDDPIATEPPDGLGSRLRQTLSSSADSHVSSSADDDLFMDDHDVVVTDDPIPTEPPDGLGYHPSSSAVDLFE